LEQSQFLGASAIRSTFEYIHSLPSTNDNELLGPEVQVRIEALLLAAQCLFATEQLEDCLTLLETFVLTEDDQDSIDPIINNSRNLYADSQSQINPIAGNVLRLI
jgi:hypothetical protein